MYDKSPDRIAGFQISDLVGQKTEMVFSDAVGTREASPGSSFSATSAECAENRTRRDHNTLSITGSVITCFSDEVRSRKIPLSSEKRSKFVSQNTCAPRACGRCAN